MSEYDRELLFIVRFGIVRLGGLNQKNFTIILNLSVLYLQYNFIKI